MPSDFIFKGQLKCVKSPISRWLLSDLILKVNGKYSDLSFNLNSPKRCNFHSQRVATKHSKQCPIWKRGQLFLTMFVYGVIIICVVIVFWAHITERTLYFPVHTVHTFNWCTEAEKQNPFLFLLLFNYHLLTWDCIL